MITLAKYWGTCVGESDTWSGEYLGFAVYARRSDLGVWCGYIGLPQGHPWVGHEPLDVSIHGGVTYAQNGLTNRTVGDFSVWYLGFDCGHYGDFIPSFVAVEPGVDPLATAARRAVMDDCAYRTLEYAQVELRGLAEQASRAAQGTTV